MKFTKVNKLMQDLGYHGSEDSIRSPGL